MSLRISHMSLQFEIANDLQKDLFLVRGALLHCFLQTKPLPILFVGVASEPYIRATVNLSFASWISGSLKGWLLKKALNLKP